MIYRLRFNRHLAGGARLGKHCRFARDRTRRLCVTHDGPGRHPLSFRRALNHSARLIPFAYQSAPYLVPIRPPSVAELEAGNCAIGHETVWYPDAAHPDGGSK